MGALTHNGDVLQGLPANASQINFDNTGTDLDSTQVENAIKEVNTKVNTNANDIDQLKSGLANLNNLNNLYLSFPATDMQDYLSKAIDHADSNFSVGLTINAIGIWQGTCTFLLQVCRASSTQTIISAIPQPDNYVNKMWIGMKENDVYSYSTIDMTVVS